MRYTVMTALTLGVFLLFAGQFFGGDTPQSASVQAQGFASLTKTHACDATLSEVKSRLPMDYGTRWSWSSLPKGIAGRYFPGQDRIEISSKIRCEDVPIVATHEWMHQLQDVTGLQDHTLVNGYEQLEIVAECAARRFADTQGWPHYKSYPEMTGVSCDRLAQEVDDLLATV